MLKPATSSFYLFSDVKPASSSFVLEQDIKRAIRSNEPKFYASIRVTQTTTWVNNFIEAMNSLKTKYGAQIEIESALEVGFRDAAGQLDLPYLDLMPDHLIVRPTLVPYGNSVYTPRQIRLLWLDELTTPEVIFRHLFRAMIGAMWKYPNIVLAEPFHLIGQIGLHEMDLPEDLLAGFARAIAETQTPIILQQELITEVHSGVEVLKLFGLNQNAKTGNSTKERFQAKQYNLLDLSPLEDSRVTTPFAYAA